MIKNFHKVRENLFRGAAPAPRDLLALKKNFGIEKIISLDAKVGDAIAPFCKKLGIKQIIIDIDPSNISSLKNLLKLNIHDLVAEDVPTFVHCLQGKDRSGLFIGLVRCILDKFDCRKAIKEAKNYGFGTGVEEPVERFYTKLISKACTHDHEDSNHVYDVVTDMRNSYEESTLNPYTISWGPYADSSVRMFPYASVNLTEYDDLGATREEYALKGIKEEILDSNRVPLVGIYDQNTQITNVVGPSLIGGGFV
jgi:hypothetical protein